MKAPHFLYKVKLYLFSKRTYTYLLKHPLSAFKFGVRILISQDDYLSFVSNLLDEPKDVIMKLMPGNDSMSDLISAFRASIAPSSDETGVSFEECLSLYLICRSLKPKYVVETGVSAGRSTTCILCALHDNNEGELYSIDPDQSSGYAIPKHLKVRWRFINATSEESLLGLLEKLKYIDVFLHDSLHTYENMYYEYRTAWPYIREGGVLLSDDVDRNSAFQDFVKSINAKTVYLSKSFAGARKCL